MWRPSLLRSDTQLNRHSYYEDSVERGPALPSLAGEHRSDVLVVGAGFAGLSAAIELAERGFRVCVLEADRVCAGASGRNGGQAIVGVACGQGELERQLGTTEAAAIWDLSLQALDLIDQRIQRHHIDCDRVRGYWYVADSARKARALETEMHHLGQRYGLPVEWWEGAAVRQAIDSPRYCAAAFDALSGHLHPLKYGLGLLRAARALGVVVHEGSPVHTLTHDATGVVVETAQGRVRADWAVVAGNCTLAEHGPGVLPSIHARIMPVGTYIIGTAPLDPAQADRLISRRAAVCDNRFALDYFRFSADHRLLFGGKVSYTTMTPPRLQEGMRHRMVRVFPELAEWPIEHVWGGFVDISMNRAPDFGRVGSRVYYLQGFSGHGVALTGLAGRLVAEAISGDASGFDRFARLQHRPFPGGPQMRTPLLAMAMLWHRWRDLWG